MPRLSVAERDAREAKVVALRRAQTPWSKIGEQLSVSAQRAHQIYAAALTRNPLSAVQVDEHRLESLELAELAIRQLMTIATAVGTSARTKVEAWSSVRAWADFKAKTTGTYVAQTVKVITLDQIDVEIAALEAQLGVRAAVAGVDDACQMSAPAS
jgi:hypothetical protein